MEDIVQARNSLQKMFILLKTRLQTVLYGQSMQWF